MHILKPIEEYNELVLAIIITIILTIVATVLAVGSVYFSEKEKCNSKAFILNTESSFGLFQGCFIKYKDEWVDYERYITIYEIGDRK